MPFWLSALIWPIIWGIVTESCEAASTIPHDWKEGRDFFYNEAEGRRQSCAEFCDLPTDYPFSCKTLCSDYKPKNRTVETSSVKPQSLTPAGNGEDQLHTNKVEYIPLIVTAVCIIFLIVTMVILGMCFKKKLQLILHRLHEIFCERLTNATLEEGAQQASEPATQPFLPQSGPTNISAVQCS